jgi:hypothetical protein
MLDAALAAGIDGADDHHGHVRQAEILSDLLEGHYDSVITVAEAFADAVLGPSDGRGTPQSPTG